MNRICNDLVEAYKGFYEDEYDRLQIHHDGASTSTEHHAYHGWIVNKISSHTPKERLEVYLEWNGILGYTNRIWEISQGEIHVS